MRAGAFGLSLLSDPLDVQVLQALAEGPLPLIDLRRAVGTPPETTLRKHLRVLTELGVLIRTQQPEFPGAATYELGASGRELLDAAANLSAWLAAAPGGPLAIGTAPAKSAVKAFVDGWTSNILRALAARPLSLTELDRLISGVNYPALERRLGAMRLAGQIEPTRGNSGSTPYKVTRWLREAICPLFAAAKWEYSQPVGEGEHLGRLDVEAAFLLAIPLLELPPEADGSCRLTVELSNGDHNAVAGVVVTVEQGRLLSCLSNLRVEVEGWASGTAAAWVGVLSGREATGIDIGGEGDLTEALLAGLRRTLTLGGRSELVTVD